jgi:uncharacterized protein
MRQDWWMLSPMWPLTSWILGAVSLALVTLLAVRAIRKDRTEYRHFKTLTESADRQRMYRKWLLASFTSFGGASIVLLALDWQFVPLLLAAANRWDITRAIAARFTDDGGLVIAIIVGVILGLLALTAVAAVSARRDTAVLAIGDIQAMLPRNRQELVLTGLMSINAGVVEELLMRLALPALLFGATGSAVFAVVASILIFGSLHVYQGPWGVLGTTVIGALMMGLYLVTGSILLPMVVHALIDLRSLVLIPMVAYRVHNKSANDREEQSSETNTSGR